MKNKKPKLYFAHSKLIYDTDLEKQQLELIEQKFPKYEIISPNVNIVFSGMIGCFQIIEDCQLLIFSTIDNFIGKGVHSEIEFAKNIGIKILWLNDESFYENFSIKIFDSHDWILKFAKVRICKK